MNTEEKLYIVNVGGIYVKAVYVSSKGLEYEPTTRRQDSEVFEKSKAELYAKELKGKIEECTFVIKK